LTSDKTRQVLSKLEKEIKLPDDLLEKLGWVIRIMTRLRASDGCPWDKVQTHESLLKNLLEETYEFIDTVNNKDDKTMREELGDLFMQVVFHAEVAAERGAFNLADVAHDLADKLVRRHPHVFGDEKAKDQDEALTSWNNAKKKEGVAKIALEEVPLSMPALLRARKVQEKAGRVGFEWTQVEGAMVKVEEELIEFKKAIKSGYGKDTGEELGDLLFAVVNVARYVNQCPEVALTGTTDKFIRRFHYIEKRLKEEGKTPDDATLEEMDGYWEEAKVLENTG